MENFGKMLHQSGYTLHFEITSSLLLIAIGGIIEHSDTVLVEYFFNGKNKGKWQDGSIDHFISKFNLFDPIKNSRGTVQQVV